MLFYHIFQTSDLKPIAQDILTHKYPKTVVLQGELGAGKTTFVQTFVSLLDEEYLTSSPTFTLMNDYYINNIHIHHFDLYRLSGAEEALEWGFEEFVVDCDFAFIEWAERALELIPTPYTLINIQHGENENSRLLTISIIQ